MSQPDTKAASGTSAVRVADVRFEHHREPLGIGERAPRLSWTVETEAAGWRQAAYEVEARGDRQAGTKRVESAESVLVPWPFFLVEVAVPPGATAAVTLPLAGLPTFEVASGAYCWSYPAHPAPRKRLTLDSTLGEASDDPDAWAALMLVLPDDVRRHGGPRLYDRTPIRKVLSALAVDEATLAEVEKALG